MNGAANFLPQIVAERLASEGSTPSLATMVLQPLSNYLLALVHIEIWPTTRPLDLMPSGKRKNEAGDDLPDRRSSASVVHRILGFKIEVNHSAACQTPHFAGTEADRDLADVVSVIKIPEPRRSEIVVFLQIVEDEWLHGY